jgi:hypothetical protein
VRPVVLHDVVVRGGQPLVDSLVGAVDRGGRQLLHHGGQVVHAE